MSKILPLLFASALTLTGCSSESLPDVKNSAPIVIENNNNPDSTGFTIGECQVSTDYSGRFLSGEDRARMLAGSLLLSSRSPENLIIAKEVAVSGVRKAKIVAPSFNFPDESRVLVNPLPGPKCKQRDGQDRFNGFYGNNNRVMVAPSEGLTVSKELLNITGSHEALHGAVTAALKLTKRPENIHYSEDYITKVSSPILRDYYGDKLFTDKFGVLLSDKEIVTTGVLLALITENNVNWDSVMAVFDESSYALEGSPGFGHPESSEEELYTSALNVLLRYPDSVRKKIESLPEDKKIIAYSTVKSALSIIGLLESNRSIGKISPEQATADLAQRLGADVAAMYKIALDI
jgi:hypothetical protein